MSLDPITAVLPGPSQPSTISYGVTAANIDATNSYPNGFAIDLTTTKIGAFLATVPSLIKITPGSSTQAIWIKNTSGNQSSPCVVICVGGTINGKASYTLTPNGQFTIFGRRQRQPHQELNHFSDYPTNSSLKNRVL